MIGEATTGLLGNSGKLRPIHGNYLSNFLHTLYIYFSKEHGRCMYYDRLNNTYIPIQNIFTVRLPIQLKEKIGNALALPERKANSIHIINSVIYSNVNYRKNTLGTRQETKDRKLICILFLFGFGYLVCYSKMEFIFQEIGKK